MNSLFQYLLELNIAMVVLYLGYRLLFEKDKNFTVRRIYLIATMAMPVLLLFLPESARHMAGRMAPVSFRLEQITVFSQGAENVPGSSPEPMKILMILYFCVAALGMIKFLVDVVRIMLAAKSSPRLQVNGLTVHVHPELHASSFFGYIFADPARVDDDSFQHILEHEQVHKREWHSADRIMAELIVLINWFNPVAWIVRRSVIQNLEYLTDYIVVNKGTDLQKYQLSILNQYIGSASITNQFSSQIKNRINMLNRNDRMGSSWKLAMIFPMIFLLLFLFSCTDREEAFPAGDKTQEQSILDQEVFYIVEEMPLFQDEKPEQIFRKYIAQNLRYPAEAAKNGVTGRVFITFVVTSEGKVVIPERENLAEITGKKLGEVVVVAYRPLNEETPKPDDQYVKLLKEEVIRVVNSSPEWKPGKQRGKEVNVIYTFPINFVLQ